MNILHLSRQTCYVYQDKIEKKWDKFKKKRHEFGIKLPQKRDKIAHYRLIEEIHCRGDLDEYSISVACLGAAVQSPHGDYQ